MKKTAKFFYIVASLLVALFTGIMTIIVTSKMANAIKLIDSSGVLIPKYHILILICCCITLFFAFVASIIFAILYKNDPEKNHLFQIISLIINIAIILIVIVAYFVIQAEGYGAISDTLKAEYGYVDYNEASEIAMMVYVFYGQLFFFNLLHSISTIILNSLLVHYSKKVKVRVIEEDSQLDSNEEEKEPIAVIKELSPADQLRKEIEEIKQSIEIQQLKEEYSELYKQLNAKKDK